MPLQLLLVTGAARGHRAGGAGQCPPISHTLAWAEEADQLLQGGEIPWLTFTSLQRAQQFDAP
ncbi:hypothetical protein, partial [Aeromonas hydrophila]|uniref:hypothetical protein n=1 Tax=Aeromonas hydrophila TaxID=644 RepID=UPI003EC946DD